MLFNLRACASHEGTGEGGIRTLGAENSPQPFKETVELVIR
jgi:hypothetical protein